MYYSVGWAKILASGVSDVGIVKQMKCHPLKDLVIALTENALILWHARLQVVLGCFKETKLGRGRNREFAVRPDGRGVAIADDQGSLELLELTFTREKSGTHTLAHCSHFQSSLPCGVEMDQLRCGCEIGRISFEVTCSKSIPGNIFSLQSIHGYLMVSSGSGQLYLLNWLGVSEEGPFNVSALSLASDLLPHSSAHPLCDEDVTVSQVDHCNNLNAFLCLFSDGRAACFVSGQSAQFSLRHLVGVWIPDVHNTSCIAINGRFCLSVVGKMNGCVEVFSLEETTGAWFHLHTLSIPTDLYPQGLDSLGPVTILEWTDSDQMVLAVSWANGGVALWTVYGSLLSFTLGADTEHTPSALKTHRTRLSCICWSKGSYSLWTAPSLTSEEPDQIYVLSFIKSSIVNNPTTTNHMHILLQGSDRLHLQVSTSVVANSNKDDTPEVGSAIASTPHWRVLQVPESYLVLNWPIRYCCINSTGHMLAVSGKAGMALYSCISRKWKLFSNEQQEQSIVCCGGMVWWKDIVVFPCIVNQRTVEVRFYSLHSKLDQSCLLHSLKLICPVEKINLHGDHLLILSTNCTLALFHLSRHKNQNGVTLHISKCYEKSISAILSHSSMAISIMTSSLRAEPEERGDPSNEEHGVESILYNVSGKLLLSQKLQNIDINNHKNQLSFGSPICLASQVEVVWTPPTSDCRDNHLLLSLWLHVGAEGLKVWLPLFPKANPQPTFLSKRITLTLETNIYPQVVLFGEAVVLGLCQEVMYLPEARSSATQSATAAPFPFATLERSIQPFLHPILRQLLKRNLGMHALEVAKGCCHLPYFTHTLECMLHEVLEEEAPGKLPKPDPLLPQVVQFIKQFPQFLKTVSSCARKTEVALWNYLFAAVGKPKDLFEECISSGNLATAATYLIIIQNLETFAVSRNLATRLLECALEERLWDLAKNLIRYLQAIGGGDVPMATPKTTPNTPFSIPAFSPVESGDKAREGEGAASPASEDGGRPFKGPQFVPEAHSKVAYFIDLLLSRYARKLLSNMQVRELGNFAANLEFDLISWFEKERCRVAKIDNCVKALLALHQDFQWPLPLKEEDPVERNTRDAVSVTSYHDNSDRLQTSISESGSESLQRSYRPPDLNLMGVSNLAEPPPSADQVKQVTLQIVENPVSLLSWQPQHSESSSDLDQVSNLSGSSSFKLPHWLSKLPSKPSEQSEDELRYLLEVASKSCCLGWVFLCAVLIQDGHTIRSLVERCDQLPREQADTPIVIANLIRTVEEFIQWTYEECHGYQCIVQDCIQVHQVLSGLKPQSPVASRLPSNSSEVLSQCDTATLPQVFTPESNFNSQSETEMEPESSNCVLS